MKKSVLIFAAACCIAAGSGGAFDYNAGSVGPDFRFAGWRGPLARIYDQGWQKVIDGRRNGQTVMAGGMAAEFMLDGKNLRLFKRTSAGMRGNGMTEPGGGHSQPGGYIYTHFDLGLICCPYGESELADKALNWTTQTLTFEYMPADESEKSLFLDSEYPTLSVTWSRLTPAILINAEVEALLLLGGPQGNWMPTTREYKMQQLSPRFVAFRAESGAVVAEAPRVLPSAAMAVIAQGEGPLAPPAGFKNWMLMWFGDAKGIFANRFPTWCCSGGNPDDSYWAGRPYWADIPVLLVFENAPAGVSAPESGGLLLDFIGPAGKLVLVPMFGERYPAASETAKWKDKLPEDIVAICDWWAERVREYPVRVEESYEYDAASDAITVVNKFQFERVGDMPAVRFAPVPPMLGLAAEHGFPVRFNGELRKSSCASSYGWYCGLDGVEEARWEITGLGKYIDEMRDAGAPSAGEQPFLDRLGREADKIFDAGMLAPALFAIHRGVNFRKIWAEPSDSMFYLSDVVALLPDRKARLLEYCAQQDARLPAGTPAEVLPPDFGARREWGGESVGVERLVAQFNDVREMNLKGERKQCGGGFAGGLHEFLNHLTMPQAFYNISFYLLNGGAFDLAGRWPQLSRQLEPWLRQSDWSSLGWFVWDSNRQKNPTTFLWIDGDYGVGGANDANVWFAGALGYARLARLAGDAEAEKLGRGLFAKAAALRLAMNKLAQYYYNAGIYELPLGKNLILRQPWRGHKEGEIIQLGPEWDILTRLAHSIIIDAGGPHRQSWAAAEDDTRVPGTMNEFGVSLADTGDAEAMGWGLLIALNGMTPELGRFLRDFAQSENKRYLEQIMDQQPDWFLTHADSIYGCEHSDNMPQNGHYLFLGLAWLADAPASQLAKYLDAPLVRVGDYYYLQKLSEIIRAYRGAQWRKCLAGSARE